MLKILWLSFVSFTVIILAATLIIQLPQVQTAIADRVTADLSKKLDGNISVEKIHFKPFTTLVLKNILITDRNPAISPIDSTAAPIDTFFRAEYLIAQFTLNGLINDESLKIQRAYIKNAQMNLVLEDKTDAEGNIVSGNNLSRIFRLKNNEEKTEPKPDEIFRINDISIDNMGFAMIARGSRRSPYYEGGIDWNDLDIKNIHLTAQDMYFKDGIMYGNAESLSFREKAGFKCVAMSGKAKVGRGKTIVENLKIKDEWSDLNLPLFMMSYKDVGDFKDFIKLVKLDGEIENSILDFRTIACFAPKLKGNTLRTDLSGVMSGTVSDFTVKDIKVASHAGGFSATVNGRMTGIPETYQMWIDAEISNLRLTTKGLGLFVSQWMREGELDMSQFADGTTFYGFAKAHGYLNNLDTRATLKSSIGSLKADVRLDEIIRPSEPIRIGGSVSTKDLNIGNVINSRLLGPATIKTGMSMTIDEGVSIDLDSLIIDRLNFKGYDYKDIMAKGNYSPNALSATVISKDPNLNFIFQGGYAKSAKSRNTVYKINASVGNADLNAINIDNRGKSLVQFRTKADFTKTAKGDILGRIDIGEIMLENKAGRYDIGDIVMTSHSANNRYTARLNSSFANATYSGTASIVDFIKDIKGITIDRELPALTNDSTFVWRGNSYDVDLVCHDMQNMLAFAAPGVYVENGSALSARVSSNGQMLAKLTSGRMAIKKNYLKEISMTLDNMQDVLKGELRCNEISIASIHVTDNLLQLYADDNHIGAGYSFDNHTDNETAGEFIVNGEISGYEDSHIFDIDIKPSSLKYNSKEWTIQPSSIRIEGSDITIDSFGAVSGEEAISLHGRTSENEGDILSLNLERFDLSALNSLLPSDFRVKGAVTGSATLTSPLSAMNLDVDILCDSSYIADIPLGVITMGTDWNEDRHYFDIYARNELNGIKNLDISGQYFPEGSILDANAELNSLEIGYTQPLLNSIFSEINGKMSGKVNIKGPMKRMKLTTTDARLDNTWLKVAYTGVPYIANGPFHIDETGIYFDNIAIKDRYDGTGTINGSINYDYFQDISFDMDITANRIEGIALGEKDNEYFYGSIFGTGDVQLKGPISSLVMTIDATTAKPGKLHIPTNASSTASKGTNLLKFKEIESFKYIDPYEIFVQKTVTEEESPNEFLTRVKVNARPDIEAFVEIDKESGNVLSGRGNGNIVIEASSDIFNINGDYTIESGNYKFVTMGLVSRDFQIQEGSSIRFAGDILDSSLDIDAIYKTKASIATLISDTTSVANRRTVECGISIKDKLSNPQLSFSIDIPDLDPTIKSRVESALSTEDKVQKQFLSLIISNNFLPDEQSGIVNNTSALYSNVSEMMANQINNIFQKLNIPLDLGLRYQPNNKGNDMFDVAVSTQLFNNRVVVNGNIGNKQYSSGNTKNEVVGDIDIEIKLDRSGAFRLNIFSHSADQYTNYLDNSQRNGVGITYQTEFNSFKQFFRNLFLSRKRRLQIRMAEEDAMKRAQKTQIKIQEPTN